MKFFKNLSGGMAIVSSILLAGASVSGYVPSPPSSEFVPQPPKGVAPAISPMEVASFVLRTNADYDYVDLPDEQKQSFTRPKDDHAHRVTTGDSLEKALVYWN